MDQQGVSGRSGVGVDILHRMQGLQRGMEEVRNLLSQSGLCGPDEGGREDRSGTGGPPILSPGMPGEPYLRDPQVWTQQFRGEREAVGRRVMASWMVSEESAPGRGSMGVTGELGALGNQGRGLQRAGDTQVPPWGPRRPEEAENPSRLLGGLRSGETFELAPELAALMGGVTNGNQRGVRFGVMRPPRPLAPIQPSAPPAPSAASYGAQSPASATRSPVPPAMPQLPPRPTRIESSPLAVGRESYPTSLPSHLPD